VIDNIANVSKASDEAGVAASKVHHAATGLSSQSERFKAEMDGFLGRCGRRKLSQTRCCLPLTACGCSIHTSRRPKRPSPLSIPDIAQSRESQSTHGISDQFLGNMCEFYSRKNGAREQTLSAAKPQIF